MSKWLNKFLHETGQNGSDKTDRTDKAFYLSGLSDSFPGLLDKNLGNMSERGPDKSDRIGKFNLDVNMSVLSTPSYDLLQKKVPYSLDEDSLKYAFEERMAIAEMDGQQSSLQAQRIAYMDAFIAVISTLPYRKGGSKNWFEKRIRDTQDWLIAQGLQQPK